MGDERCRVVQLQQALTSVPVGLLVPECDDHEIAITAAGGPRDAVVSCAATQGGNLSAGNGWDGRQGGANGPVCIPFCGNDATLRTPGVARS
eukprot:6285308-Prymnesium_polylepis.2